MLIDNNSITENQKENTLIEFFKENISKGNFDVVTGFFSISVLAILQNRFPNVEHYRMVLGNLIPDLDKEDLVIDLLSDDLSLDGAFDLNKQAQDAVKFLNSEKTEVKSVDGRFCHAKTYIYKDGIKKNRFYAVGSSNLTEAGLGIKKSSNIELNTLITGGDADYEKFEDWFEKLWKDVANEKIKIKGSNQIKNCKEYIKDEIKKIYKEYDPLILYYKVLYELLYSGVASFLEDENLQRRLQYLSETYYYSAVGLLLQLCNK